MLFSGLNQEVRKEEYICMCSVQIVNICYQQSSKEFYAETWGIQHKSIKKKKQVTRFSLKQILNLGWGKEIVTVKSTQMHTLGGIN